MVCCVGTRQRDSILFPTPSGRKSSEFFARLFSFTVVCLVFRGTLACGKIFTVFPAAESLAKLATQNDLLTLLLTAQVDVNISVRFPARGIESRCISVALADSEAHFTDALLDFVNIGKSEEGSHRMQAARLIGFWQQARTRDSAQQQVEAAARAHGISQELSHGTWRNLLRAFASSHGHQSGE